MIKIESVDNDIGVLLVMTQYLLKCTYVMIQLLQNIEFGMSSDPTGNVHGK